jgi:uncharacterized protein (TIGR01244 family)
MFRKIDDNFLASPQITAEDVEIALQNGVTLIVNNRPDGEEPGAPQGADIAAAAAVHGLGYVAIPITHAGFSHPQIDAMAAAMDQAGGGVILAYCRSGTRSTNLWALTRARLGDDVDGLCAKAAAQGYDLSGLRPTLDTLAAGAR